MPTAILLKDVDNLGERGAVVDVSKGFLRNYLIPRQLAQPATPASIEAARRAQEAAERAAAQAAERAKEQVDTRKIQLEQPIRHVGTYLIQIELAEGATANVKTMVVEGQ